MASMFEIEETMTDEWKGLTQFWQELSDQWKDGAQRYFQRTIWSSYDEIVPATLAEVRELFDAIIQARQEIP